MSLLRDPGVASVLAEARQAHVAVETTKGPHVTPQLYAVDGDDVWFFAAASTVKAKALRRRPHAGAVVRAGTTSVALVGDVTRFDPGDPGALLSGASGLPDAARAVAGYALRNAPDLMGFARDAVRRRVGSVVPVRRVLFRLRPSAIARLEDDAVVDHWGAWPTDADTDGPEVLPPDRGVAAVASWLSAVGPVAGPARWDESASCVTLPASLVALAPSSGPEASVVIDEYGGSGPSPKRGTLLRGTGELRQEGGQVVISLEPATLTTWQGVEMSTASPRSGIPG